MQEKDILGTSQVHRSDYDRLTDPSTHSVIFSTVADQSHSQVDDKETPLTWSHNASTAEHRGSSSHSQNSPYDMVRSAVSPTDSGVPSLTFRSVILGLFFAAVMGFTDQLMVYRDTPLQLTSYVVQILSFPLGYFMSRILPTRSFETFGYTWSFNPGRFSIKEHALISIFASSATSGSYVMSSVILQDVRYGNSLGFGASVLLTLSTQLLGFSFTGIVREVLIYPAAMIFPASLVSVTLFRTFHDSTSYMNHAKRVKFFWIAFAGMFLYSTLPGFIMPILGAVPILCMAAPDNIIAHQLGGAFHGLGMLNFTLDWSMVSSGYFGPPVAIPWYIACNMFAGFVIVFWLIVPIGYYSDTWGSSKLPIYANGMFLSNGSRYNVSMIIGPDRRLDSDAYAAYGYLRIPFAVAVQNCRALIAITSLLVYTILHHGKDVYRTVFQANDDHGYDDDDIHARLMRRYPEVPHWWYAAIFVSMLAMGIAVCETYHLLPWYWMLLGTIFSFTFVIPNGILMALSNQRLGLNIISALIAGYGIPGNYLANTFFRVYSHVPMWTALTQIGNHKMAHYLKIPPRHVFLAQISGIVVMAFVQSGVGTWMLSTVDGFCTTNPGWSCVQINTYYESSVMWGLIGPGRLLHGGSPYALTKFMFIIGAIVPVPVWYLQRKFPGSFWHNIHLPVLLSAMIHMPGAPSTVMTGWFLTCFIFQYVIHKFHYRWFKRFAFTLIAAFDSSVTLSAVLIYFIFRYSHIEMPRYWGTNINLCPLTSKNSGYRS